MSAHSVCARFFFLGIFFWQIPAFTRANTHHTFMHTAHRTQHRTTHTQMLTDRMHARTLVAHKCLHKPTPSMAQVHTGERPHVSGEPEGRGVGRLSDNLSPDHATVSGGCATPPPSTCKRRAASTHPIQKNCHQATSACAAGRPRHPDVVQPYHGTADSARAHDLTTGRGCATCARHPGQPPWWGCRCTRTDQGVERDARLVRDTPGPAPWWVCRCPG